MEFLGALAFHGVWVRSSEVMEENCSQQSETFQNLDPISSQMSVSGMSQEVAIEVCAR